MPSKGFKSKENTSQSKENTSQTNPSSDKKDTSNKRLERSGSSRSALSDISNVQRYPGAYEGMGRGRQNERSPEGNLNRSNSSSSIESYSSRRSDVSSLSETSSQREKPGETLSGERLNQIMESNEARRQAERGTLQPRENQYQHETYDQDDTASLHSQSSLKRELYEQDEPNPGEGLDQDHAAIRDRDSRETRETNDPDKDEVKPEGDKAEQSAMEQLLASMNRRDEMDKDTKEYDKETRAADKAEMEKQQKVRDEREEKQDELRNKRERAQALSQAIQSTPASLKGGEIDPAVDQIAGG